MSTKTFVLVVSYIVFLMVMIGLLSVKVSVLYEDLHSYEKQVEVLKQDVKDLEVDKRELAEKVNFYLTERDQMTISYELGGVKE
jgi:cell division protein FtsB